MINCNKNQSGSILLYSLIVISLITAIAIIISVIVVNEIKLTSAASNGVQAYYAAESGIEQGLFAVKIFRNNQEDTLEEVRNLILSYEDNNFENNASYKNIQTDILTSKVENAFVKENDFIQIEYYDVNDPLDPSVNVVGITVKNSGDDPATWAEVSWTAWDSNGVLGTSNTAKKFIGPTDLARVNGWPINNLDVFDSDPVSGFDGTPVGYRVRIKALKAIPTATGEGNLSSLTVIPYDGTPPPLGASHEVTDLPTQLVIKSVGERNNFKQSLTATVPWNLPLFGLYDYVLFSEGEILKDIILNAPTYSSGVIEIEGDIRSNCDGNCNPYDDGDCCGICKANGWSGLECISPDIYPFNNIECVDSDVNGDGWCRLMVILPADSSHWDNYWGFTLPIPDGVPEGDEYYVSLRTFYDDNNCIDKNGDGSCDRDLSVEINGQSSVIKEPNGSDGSWVTCTIPESFSLGDPILLPDDPSRTIQITTRPFPPDSNEGDDGWQDSTGFSESVMLDWYQLSTYKIFPDCY